MIEQEVFQPYELVEYTPDQAEQVVDFINSVFAEYDWKADTIIHFPDLRDNLYDGQRGKMWLLKDGSRIIGASGVHRSEKNEHVFLLKRLYLVPEARGGGKGRALAEAAINYASEQGGMLVELNTDKKMDRAIDLYTSLGFNTTQEKKSSVTMQRELA